MDTDLWTEEDRLPNDPTLAEINNYCNELQKIRDQLPPIAERVLQNRKKETCGVVIETAKLAGLTNEDIIYLDEGEGYYPTFKYIKHEASWQGIWHYSSAAEN